MADPYRWGGMTPPAVALLKKRRVQQGNRIRHQPASRGDAHTGLQTPCAGCAQVVARAVCAEQGRQERAHRAISAQIGDV